MIAKLLAVAPLETSIRLEGNWWGHLSLWTGFFLHLSSNQGDFWGEGAAGVSHFVSWRGQRLSLCSSSDNLMRLSAAASPVSFVSRPVLATCGLTFSVTVRVRAFTISEYFVDGHDFFYTFWLGKCSIANLLENLPHLQFGYKCLRKHQFDSRCLLILSTKDIRYETHILFIMLFLPFARICPLI